MSGAPACGCEARPMLRLDRQGGFVPDAAVPVATKREAQPAVLEGVLLTNARRPSATATCGCGCGCGGSCAAEAEAHPCTCGNTSAARIRTMEPTFRTDDPRLRLWQLQQEDPSVALDARIAGLEAVGITVRGDPRQVGERTWRVPTSEGLRLETTGMGGSARLDRFGRSASERRPEELLGPFANALVPPGVGQNHHPGDPVFGVAGEGFPAACSLGQPEEPVCHRESALASVPGEVFTPSEMWDAAQKSEVTQGDLDQLSADVGVILADLSVLGDVLANTTRLVTATGKDGTGTPLSPWNFEQAVRVLAQPVQAPGLKVYFRVDDVFDLATHGRNDNEYWYQDKLCSRYATKPGMLLIRISGSEEAGVVISSYAEQEGLAVVGTGLARFVGCAPCPTREEGEATYPCADTDANHTATGIVIDNVEYLELSWIEVTRFQNGVVGHGHCRDLRLNHLDVHHNLSAGLRFEAASALSSLKGGDCLPVCSVGFGGKSRGPSSWPCAVLTEDRGYPDRIEITECLLHDNGQGKGSAGTQLFLVYYCTGFHIHRNLFYCSPVGIHWQEKSRQNFGTMVDGVPGAITSIVNCESTTSASKHNLQDEGACKANLDAAAAAAFASVGGDFWLKRWAQVINSTEEGGCHRSGGDGITLERSSSGHIIDHNIFIGLQADCSMWQRPGGDKESYGYWNQYTGRWIGPEESCKDASTCRSNTSDGDGIDFKGLRPRTPTSGELTVVHENLFLFCEGPAILSHYGTLGLDIARNIFAGNACGINIVDAGSYAFFNEWTSSSDFEVNKDAYEYLETGCFRIYRNLFLMNNRVDDNCDQVGSGFGIRMKVSGRSEFRFNDETEDVTVDGVTTTVSINDACNYDADAERMNLPTRIREVWIVNNTFHGHGEHAIWVMRPEFDPNEADPYTGDDPQRPYLLQDFHIYNNIMSDSFSGWDPTNEDPTYVEQMAAETNSTFAHLAFIVVGDNDLDTLANVFDYYEEPTLFVDYNLYNPTFYCKNDQTVDSAGLPGHECALRWESNDNQWAVGRFMDDPPAMEQHWTSGGDPTAAPAFIGSSTKWDWQADAWDTDWAEDGVTSALWRGSLEGGSDISIFGLHGKWVALPASWSPWAYVPSLTSPALEQAKTDTGLYDYGWFLRSGAVVDVGQGPDLFYRFKRSTTTVVVECVEVLPGSFFTNAVYERRITSMTTEVDADQGATDLGALHLPESTLIFTGDFNCPRTGPPRHTVGAGVSGPSDASQGGGGATGPEGGGLCVDPTWGALPRRELMDRLLNLFETGFWPETSGVPCPLPIPESIRTAIQPSWMWS